MKIIPNYKLAKLTLSFKSFIKTIMNQPWTSGAILLLCVIVAMLLANLPSTREIYEQVLQTTLEINIQSPLTAEGTRLFDISVPHGMNLEKFINDILMVIFFFSVGLEIKREIKYGELSSPKKALLPVIAAAGGMAMPAIIFTVFNYGTAGASGWGIPTATDIAFAVGILAFLGDKVPVSLKVFLTALAIADDLGAILVVAFFYGGSVNLLLLLIAAVVIAFVCVLNNLGEKNMIFYIIPAIAVWFLFYYAGIHATMSGVVMAMMIPMSPRYSHAYLLRRSHEYENRMALYDGQDSADGQFPNDAQRHCLRRLAHINNGAMGMSYRLEHALAPIVNYGIMPIFALANAGVQIPDLSYFNIFQYSPELGSVGMGIFFGLLIGKPLGITIASWIAIKMKVGAMPGGATWKMLFAVACLGGIGFTMSIFVDTLSFTDVSQYTESLQSAGKISVLMGSLCAGIFGSILINAISRIEKK